MDILGKAIMSPDLKDWEVWNREMFGDMISSVCVCVCLCVYVNFRFETWLQKY